MADLVQTRSPDWFRGPASQLLEFVWASFDGLVAGGLGGLVVGFGTLYWALDPGQPARLSWPNQIYFSGVTFFTLGYGDVLPHTGTEKLLAVLEAGTGLGFIAIVIGYLPVLYQLFARREAKVIMLDAAAGSPPSAMTLLVRHAEGESPHELEHLLREWQQWCAELIESQLSYPMLAYYRSQHDNQSWLAAIATIMDCCAAMMAGLKGVRTFQARLTFSTARQAVVEMGRVFEVGALAAAPDRLPSGDYERLRAGLAEAGLYFADEDEAEQKLDAFRNTYEPFLQGLADYLVISLPGWVPAGSPLDNWQNNPRGKSARQLIESVPAKPD